MIQRPYSTPHNNRIKHRTKKNTTKAAAARTRTAVTANQRGRRNHEEAHS
nr:MAG TPA: hypothetical protein [Caudoviricetes sp.]